jgi:hypothetical protein
MDLQREIDAAIALLNKVEDELSYADDRAANAEADKEQAEENLKAAISDIDDEARDIRDAFAAYDAAKSFGYEDRMAEELTAARDALERLFERIDWYR